ncbi:type II toxin-antitoxin system mRNA interferase toxin, RelE/StbE family [Candidatus Peregrinibacteria bacterium CG_4_10_14_0_2_um_filter_38_24]|nr:MAG: type II toxin-antitoxin system mRNA interferase toxin, RelE/StbE family [Candidatus Peregrinibacteria bacterium CG_4_10_14_0_2_um_filter_38_24]PJC39374.1 MAG: type II toxin-antitoxin system mRNA interferase toxin, RelE/StbE family [Candidatus Peregrinibacteria bacterium CG_4_9_14_0_2_um_filter_38_9]
MYKIIYSENSVKDLRKIDKSIAQRIIKKILFFSEQKDIFKFSKPLKGFGNNKYRFRIGDYRVIFKVDGTGEVRILMILNIKHRKEIYNFSN